MPAHVALNAQLLFGPASYRSAGIHQYIDQLLRHLPAIAPEFRYTVFTGSGAAVMPGAAIRRTAWPTSRPVGRIAWEQFIQPLELARLRPDLLHSLAFVSPWVALVPAVVTVYDLSFRLLPDHFQPAQRLYLSAFTTASCRRARRVIAISESTRADVTRLLGVPRERVDLAYPGVEPRFRPLPTGEVEAFRARQGLPDRFILYLGTLEPRKKLGALITAFAQLAAAEPDLRLVLAGGRGWDYDVLFRQVEALDLGDRVTFTGYVDAADLPLWYNAAAVFAYPSSYEGFGMPVTEALACGRPVVTTTAASLPEAGGAAAWLVPPGDAPALADALRAALASGSERREAALAHAARFTWEATAASTVLAYRRALDLAPSQPA